MKDIFAAAYQYGMPVVYSVVLIFGLYKFAIRVLNSYERRETSYAMIINSGMAGITSSLQELSKAHMLHLQMYERISKDVKDGFDRIHDANKFQRDEHKLMLDGVRDQKCKAK